MDSKGIFNNLFVLDIANNHMGDPEHGLRIVKEFAAVAKEFPYKVAIKFQYRNLDTFIHPDYRNSSEFKYVKRFSETKLPWDQFKRMKDEIAASGLLSMCTPFDEASMDIIEEHGFDIVKIASCSFTDWPLLERISKTDKPIVASTAGASLADIDNVVSFFKHRGKDFCLMHCVGIYPTPNEMLELNQIDFFKRRYPGLAIGYSTHESPENTDPIKIAIAKGAQVFERHIGVATEKYKLNAYSSTPAQFKAWLEAAAKAWAICGSSDAARRPCSEKEMADLRGLKRGVFCKTDLPAGKRIEPEDVFFAIPNFPGQILANDFSKYHCIVLKKDLKANAPVLESDATSTDIREKVESIIRKECALLKEGNIKLPDKLALEISHHYGLESFDKWGCAIITCVNREYCKKIILLLPGQENPAHAHKIKEETFHVLHGEVTIKLDGEERNYKAGDIVVVERGKMHSFSSKTGMILEEISTTHHADDSYYKDQSIMANKNRKTKMSFRANWMEELLH